MKEKIKEWWIRLPPYVKDTLSLGFFNKHNLVLTDPEISDLYKLVVSPNDEFISEIAKEIIDDLYVDEENAFEEYNRNWYIHLLNKLK